MSRRDRRTQRPTKARRFRLYRSRIRAARRALVKANGGKEPEQ